MSERTDVPSWQTHFFRCGRLLVLLVPVLFAWDVAGSCLPHAFGVGEEGIVTLPNESGPYLVVRTYNRILVY